jgi:hypothetical protein
MARTNYLPIFNHYVYCDLDLSPITLNQGHDTSLCPGQQSCDILLKSTERIRSYGSDKLGLTPDDGQQTDKAGRIKKSRKLIICDFLLSPRAITSRKIHGSKPNSMSICI